MNLDIKRNIIDKIRDDNEKSIISTIEESISTNNELVLPGLGVILELFWKDLKKEEKENIASIIINNIKNKET